MIIWIISALLVITTLTFLVIDYSGYKKGQAFGLVSIEAAGLYRVNSMILMQNNVRMFIIDSIGTLPT